MAREERCGECDRPRRALPSRSANANPTRTGTIARANRAVVMRTASMPCRGAARRPRRAASEKSADIRHESERTDGAGTSKIRRNPARTWASVRRFCVDRNVLSKTLWVTKTTVNSSSRQRRSRSSFESVAADFIQCGERFVHQQQRRPCDQARARWKRACACRPKAPADTHSEMLR